MIFIVTSQNHDIFFQNNWSYVLWKIFKNWDSFNIWDLLNIYNTLNKI